MTISAIRFSFFIIVFFFFSSSYAQKDNDYFTEIAGDSTLNSGKVYTKDFGDTLKFTLDKGIQRLVFSKGIKINDKINLQLLNSTWQIIDYENHETYIDFYNEFRKDIYVIMTAEQRIEEEVAARLFSVYNMNFSGDAPNFTLTDIYGNVYNNENLLGKIVVLNFWGIWCKPCVKEIPQLNKLAKFYSDRGDVIFLAVSSDPEKSIKKFIKKKKFRYNHISDKGANELSRDLMDLGMYGVPVHIVLDKRGNVVFRFLGDHPDIDNVLSIAKDAAATKKNLSPAFELPNFFSS